MQAVQVRMWRRSKFLCRTGVTVLVMALVLLSGCAGRRESLKPDPEAIAIAETAEAPVTENLDSAPGALEPVPNGRVSVEPEGPSVAILEDGRQGFVISEPCRLDDAVRMDFEAAVAMLDEKSYEKAIALLQKIVDRSPGVTAPYIDLGMAYQFVGRTDEAEEQYKAALAMIPGHPVACNQYGLLFRKTGRFREAREIYEKALALFPDYYPLHRNLGILCDIYLDDPESALAHYEAYRLAKPADEQVNLWIAELKARLGGK